MHDEHENFKHVARTLTLAQVGITILAILQSGDWAVKLLKTQMS